MEIAQPDVLKLQPPPFVLPYWGTADDPPDAVQFSGMLESRQLYAVYQPIVSMLSGAILGFEGLIRGPDGTPWHTPAQLFAAARNTDLENDLERRCQAVVVRGFAALGLPGKLFLNVSPQYFTTKKVDPHAVRTQLATLGLSPSRIVMEITESHRTQDFPLMRELLLTFRNLGFEVAMDDLGEGFSSLRLWSELRPEFVKLDQHFIRDVHQDPLKLQFVKAIQQISEGCGSKLIAEGIETEAEFRVLRDLGIAHGQGYFISRPAPVPPVSCPEPVMRVLRDRMVSVYPHPRQASLGQTFRAEKLLLKAEAVTEETDNDQVYARFNADADLQVIPVVRDDIPVGLIHRHNLIDRFARPFRRELYGKKSCAMFMDPQPLVVDKNLPIQELSRLLVEGERRHLADGFIITDESRYLGVGTGQDLMREITQMQIMAARYANPLTLLPGNVPIAEHTERLAQAGIKFSICHCDLDHFKPYNDVYGFRQGDEILLLTAKILAQACDSERDFVGHVGGDDFVLLMQSADWERRCRQALAEFDAVLPTLCVEADRQRGGYYSEDRQGRMVFHPLPGLSIGIVQIDPEAALAVSYLEIAAAAAEAKKQAKRITGSSLFVERRRLIP